MMSTPEFQPDPPENQQYTVPEESSDYTPKRWYDRDPALAKALESLRVASSWFHAQVALNIISVIVEHRLEELQKKHSFTAEELHQHQHFLENVSVIVEHRLEELQKKHSFTAEELHQHQHFLENAKAYVIPSYGKRWYDVNETLQSAIQLLKDTPDDIQKQIIPSIALVIEQAIARDLNED